MTDTRISKDQVKHLASLAQLDLSEEEIEKFSTQLTSILQYVDKVKEVEISDDVKRDFRKLNVFREDELTRGDGQNRDEILAEMPEVEDDLLVVKKILNN